MYEFKVEGMTCGGCIKSINNALRSLDPEVKVSADLESKTLRVESSKSQKDLSALIEEAGYTVVSATSLLR